jgi:hypothetical protein
MWMRYRWIIVIVICAAIVGELLFLAVLVLPGSLGLFYQSCLPQGNELTAVVSIDIGGANRVTVQRKLLELGAYCAGNILVDQHGKQIYFYRLIDCWGIPPENYLDIVRNQADEIAKLKAQYTVIEMTCDPSGRPLF